jgi:hypothetical protein
MRASNFFQNFQPLSQNVPLKGTQTKVKETWATKSQENLDKFLRLNPAQKTKLESETERMRNRQNSTRQGVANYPLQCPRQSTTVPQTVRSSKIRNRTPWKQLCSRSETSAIVPQTVRAWGPDCPQVRTLSSRESTEKSPTFAQSATVP